MSKEWKGNKKSISTMLGISTTWNPEQRAAADYYTTDQTAVEYFMQHLKRNYCDSTYYKELFNVVWEPACGCGNISEVVKKYANKVISTDLYDRGYGHTGVDFLKTTKLPEDCMCIITNPPYSLSDEFIKHAMDLLPRSARYFALLNISYLAGKKRFNDIYKNQYLRAIHIYPNRINCYKNNENTGHSSPVNYAWFEFGHKPQYFSSVDAKYPAKIYRIEKQ